LFRLNKDNIIALNLNTGIVSQSIPYDRASGTARFNFHPSIDKPNAAPFQHWQKQEILPAPFK
jgi:hypothetical protein